MLTTAIIIGLIIVVLLIVWTTMRNKTPAEKFTAMVPEDWVDDYGPFDESDDEFYIDAWPPGTAPLSQAFDSGNEDIKQYALDTMKCSKKCCGTQWAVPFDQLTPEQAMEAITSQGKPGPFVRTNYNCGNGIDGVGCPCVTVPAYNFLTNRGMSTKGTPEPTLLIQGPNAIQGGTLPGTPGESLSYTGFASNIPLPQMNTPYETQLNQRGMFTDQRVMNDEALRRSPENLNALTKAMM